MSKVRSIKKIFIRRMIASAGIQFLILAFIFILAKNYLTYNEQESIIDELIINDSFSQEELIRYKILENGYAFDLSLRGIADEKRLDAIWFSNTLKPELGKCDYIKNTQYMLCDGKNKTYYGVTPLVANNLTMGYIITSKKYSFLSTPIYYGLVIILLAILGEFLFNFFILFLSIKNRIEKNTRNLLDFISKQKSENSSCEVDIQEYSKIVNKFIESRDEVEILEKEKYYNQAMKNLAAQVAHDIRSPLATINVIVKETHEIEEQKRIILRNATQQLNDIANVLLVKYRSRDDGYSSENNTVKDSEVIAVLLDLIVSEKRLEYKHLPITIDFNVTTNARGAFAQVVVSDFKRVISNIINNAVEAINGKGEVRITLSTTETTVNIEISDTGIGMPPELIAKVFDGSIVSNKKEGSGIGLVTAYQLIKSWGGNLKITSELNVGTTIHLCFLLLEPAPWFSANLNFVENSKVVILDDDQSIHDLWSSRFECEISSANIQLQHFYQANELIETNMDELKSAYFLCDYELIGQDKTGLDVIEQLHLGKTATLVTSRYDEREVRNRCAKLGIKILPKNYAAYVPINITKKISDRLLSGDKEPDVVLIDNDHSIIRTWKLIAKQKGKTILAFDNFSDAEKTIEPLSRNIPIYIDSDLGAEMPGEEYAKILYEKGFMNIYLATGHRASHFDFMGWVKDIVSKEPPF